MAVVYSALDPQGRRVEYRDRKRLWWSLSVVYPQLPSGYFGMFPLSYVPPLWFRIMDRRLLALPQVRGDLSRVNIDPRRRAPLYTRYGQADPLAARV